MAAQIFSAIFVIIIGVGGCVAYFWGANKLLDLTFPSRGVKGAAAIDNLRRQAMIAKNGNRFLDRSQSSK